MAGCKISTNVYRSLQGVFCVYKPAKMSAHALTNSLKLQLSNELNKLCLNEKQADVIARYKLNCEQITPGTEMHAQLSSGINKTGGSKLPSETSSSGEEMHTPTAIVSQQQDIQIFADDELSDIQELAREQSPLNMDASDVQFHPLVLGGLWREQDIMLKPLDKMSVLASGVLPYGVGKHGHRNLLVVRKSNPIKVYRVTARMGVATSNFKVTGGIVAKADHKHITQPLIDRILSAVEASHQKQQFELAGVGLHTQEAYEMASRGIIRPDYNKNGTHCVLYSIKSVDWTPPDLTIELHTANETGAYITQLIHDLGRELRCGAVCIKMRRIRVGHFDTRHCLVRSQWNSEDIIANIDDCYPSLTSSMADRLEQIAALETSNSRSIETPEVDS